MEQDPGSGWGALIVPLLLTLLIAVLANVLARQKGRNEVAWTILGAIPIVNFMLVWYFVGATNLRLERKVDDLVEALKESRR